jgi:peptide/nickel transport system permease protein
MKLHRGGFWRNWSNIVGAAAILVAVVVSIFAYDIARQSPFELSGERLAPPSAIHWFGTDDLQRDYFSRTLLGLRTSLVVGVAAAFTAALIGVLVGCSAGFLGGWWDDVLMRVTEVFFVMPRFFLCLIVLALFGPGIEKIILVIGVLSWPGTARLVRALTLALREREYVIAAVSLGATPVRLLGRHILPNTLGPVIVCATFEVSHAILLESSLSFLGLGDPERVSLGSLLEKGRPFLMTHWWIGLSPGLFIFWVVAAFNVLGDGLADLANPRLKHRGQGGSGRRR